MSLMVFTFGAAVAFSPSHRMAVESCKAPMGSRMAVFSTLMSLAGFIGGWLVSRTYNGSLLWFGMLLLVVASLAVLLRYRDKTSGFLLFINKK